VARDNQSRLLAAESDSKMSTEMDKTKAIKQAKVAPLASANFAKNSAATLPTGKIASIAANPKRSGSRAHAAYSYYATGDTAASVLAKLTDAGLNRAEALTDLRWNVSHGFITFE